MPNKINLGKIIRRVINENYDPERLYSKQSIVNQLSKSPKYIKKYVKDLPDIPCVNSEGKKSICTKIPEVLFMYLFRHF